MTGEQHTSQGEQNLVMPSDLLQYPEKGGVIPLGESYTTAGTKVEWEEHPYTRTDEHAQATERRALIATDDGNVHYLRGNTLYDIGQSQAENSFKGMQWTARSSMPDVTIGEATIFSSGARVRELVVAAGEVTAGDPRAVDTLNAADRKDVNVFEQFDAIIDNLPVAQTQQIARVRTEKDWGKVTFEQPISTHTWRIARHEEDLKDRDPGEEAPLVRSNHGVPIAPQMTPEKRKDYEYEPRILEGAGLAVRAKAASEKRNLGETHAAVKEQLKEDFAPEIEKVSEFSLVKGAVQRVKAAKDKPRRKL